MKKIAALLALSLVLGGVAYASIPDSGGVIHACYKLSASRLYLIDSPSQSCSSGETAIAWNQEGPQGATGSQGIQGSQGVQGPTGPPNATYYVVDGSGQTCPGGNCSEGTGNVAIAYCHGAGPEGGGTDFATGGSYDVIPTNNADFPLIHHYIEEFVGTGGTPPYGYRVVPRHESGVDEYRIQVMVDCVHYE